MKDIKKDMEELDTVINQEYDTDYLKDIIALIDYRIDILANRIDELDKVLCSVLGELLKHNKDFKI